MTITEQAIDHYKYGISHDIFSEPVTTYAKLSVEALEKQIPKKVIREPYFYGVTCRCPSCGLYVSNIRYKSNTTFCSDCGQALDWGER